MDSVNTRTAFPDHSACWDLLLLSWYFPCRQPRPTNWHRHILRVNSSTSRRHCSATEWYVCLQNDRQVGSVTVEPPFSCEAKRLWWLCLKFVLFRNISSHQPWKHMFSSFLTCFSINDSSVQSALFPPQDPRSSNDTNVCNLTMWSSASSLDTVHSRLITFC